MRSLRITLFASFFVFGATACDAEVKKMEFYVVMIEEMGAQFTADVAELAEQAGMRAAVARVTDDTGHTRHIVDARKRWIWLSGGNMPLSGREDPELCGTYDEPHPDPGQFYVAVESIIPFLDDRRVAEITKELKDGLSKLGYEVREEPVLCSSLSKSAAN